MACILTITLNPCIDVHVEVPALVPERKLRCSAPVLQPGGGGINVARAIKRLGGDATAIYLAAGSNGKTLTKMLDAEGVRSSVIQTEGNTRENLVVVDQSTGLQYRFVLPGPAMPDSVLKELARIVEGAGDAAFIVVSGSLPPGLPATLFGELASIAKRKKSKLVVDTSGEALKKAVEGGVYLVKCSIHELYSLSGIGESKKNGDNEQSVDIEVLARKWVDAGKCSVVVVSMGAAGALLVTDNITRNIPAPSVKPVSAVGAGDSLLAGIVWKLSQGMDLEEAVAYGCACGAAAVINPGTSLCHLRDVEELYANMHHDVRYQEQGNL